MGWTTKEYCPGTAIVRGHKGVQRQLNLVFEYAHDRQGLDVSMRVIQ